jgi:hypothetical protein
MNLNNQIGNKVELTLKGGLLFKDVVEGIFRGVTEAGEYLVRGAGYDDEEVAVPRENVLHLTFSKRKSQAPSSVPKHDPYPGKREGLIAEGLKVGREYRTRGGHRVVIESKNTLAGGFNGTMFGAGNGSEELFNWWSETGCTYNTNYDLVEVL